MTQPYWSRQARAQYYALTGGRKYAKPLLYGAGIGALASAAYGASKSYKPYGVRYAAGSKKPKRSKYKRQKKPPLVSINKKLKKLARTSDASTGNLTYRSNTTHNIICPENEQIATEFGPNTVNQIESSLQYCKFFNPSVPGTLTTANLSTGNYQRDVLFNNISQKLVFRNNYNVPCELTVYLCKVKDDTSQGVVTAWDAAVPDASNLTDSTDLNQYPSDYHLVTDLWNLTKKCEVILQPGDMKQVNHASGQFSYDPATADVHTTSYQKENKAYVWLVVLKGVIAHDSSVGTEQGLGGAGVDVESRIVYNIEYNAGTNIKYTQVNNTYDAFTNVPQVSNKPACDNQTYQIA